MFNCIDAKAYIASSYASVSKKKIAVVVAVALIAVGLVAISFSPLGKYPLPIGWTVGKTLQTVVFPLLAGGAVLIVVRFYLGYLEHQHKQQQPPPSQEEQLPLYEEPQTPAPPPFVPPIHAGPPVPSSNHPLFEKKELLHAIFERLKVRDLGRSAQVCSSWREMAYYSPLWRPFCLAQSPRVRTIEEDDYRAYYQKTYSPFYAAQCYCEGQMTETTWNPGMFYTDQRGELAFVEEGTRFGVYDLETRVRMGELEESRWPFKSYTYWEFHVTHDRIIGHAGEHGICIWDSSYRKLGDIVSREIRSLNVYDHFLYVVFQHGGLFKKLFIYDLKKEEIVGRECRPVTPVTCTRQCVTEDYIVQQEWTGITYVRDRSTETLMSRRTTNMGNFHAIDKDTIYSSFSTELSAFDIKTARRKKTYPIQGVKGVLVSRDRLVVSTLGKVDIIDKTTGEVRQSLDFLNGYTHVITDSCIGVTTADQVSIIDLKQERVVRVIERRDSILKIVGRRLLSKQKISSRRGVQPRHIFTFS